jgi:hypothetical protein
MTQASTTILCLSVALSLAGCKVRRPDQDNFVLDTSRVPVERFLGALSNRLSASWSASDVTVADADPSKIYTLESRDVTVVLVAMPHDRCNPNGPHHLSYDKAWRVDFVYSTSSPERRQIAKRELFQSAADVEERLVRFAECP